MHRAVVDQANGIFNEKSQFKCFWHNVLFVCENAPRHAMQRVYLPRAYAYIRRTAKRNAFSDISIYLTDVFSRYIQIFHTKNAITAICSDSFDIYTQSAYNNAHPYQTPNTRNHNGRRVKLAGINAYILPRMQHIYNIYMNIYEHMNIFIFKMHIAHRVCTVADVIEYAYAFMRCYRMQRFAWCGFIAIDVEFDDSLAICVCSSVAFSI